MTKARLTLISLFILGVLACAVTPAFSKEIHLFSSSFGGPCTGPGDTCEPGQLKEPAGLAVDDSTSLVNPVAGDVYVVDKGNDRVERFSASGEYKGQFNGSDEFELEGGKKEKDTAAPTGAFDKPEWVAVDNDESSPSFDDVYVADNGHKVIDKFSATGEYLGQITEAVCPEAIIPQATGREQSEKELELRVYESQREKEIADCPPGLGMPFSELDGVAVDPAGELWVYQSNNDVDNYSGAPVNEFIASRPMQVFFNYLLQGFAPASGFALGPEDDSYVKYSSFFLRFDNAGDNSGQSEGGTGFGSVPSAQTAAAFDPANNEIYVDYGTTVGAFDASDETQIETFGSEHMTASTGVAVNSSEKSALSNDVYVSDATADRVDVFDASPVPDAKTEAPSPIGKTEATLHGTVNPEGLEVESCEFEYGTGPGVYPHTAACVPPPGSGKANVAVEAKLKGLKTSTTYYYRLTATNTNGIPSSGAEEHFETPPAVDALRTGSPAQEVTPNTAKLTGTLSPDGTDAHYYFQYGTSTGYGLLSPARPGTDAGTVSAAVPAETTLVGLTASTTYDYRLVGVNSFGTTYGENQEFKTPPAVEGVSTGPAEEVTGSTAKITGSLAPDGTDAHYYFEYGAEADYYSATAPVAPGIDAGTGGPECVPPGGVKCSAVAASTVLTGLRGGTVYRYRLVAVNAFGTTYGQEKTLPTLATPVIAGAEAVNVTGSGAELTATVNPEGLQVTYCKFEYGTTTSYGKTVRCKPPASLIGEGTEPVPVSVAISKLSPNTTYYWRLSVKDENGEAYEPGHTFIYSTASTAGSELPDHRAYELVSPPFKNGGLIGDVFGSPEPAIAESGSSVIAFTIQCFSPAEAAAGSCNANRVLQGEPYAFTRTPTEWKTTALAPLAPQFGENTPWLVSADAGTALFTMPTGPAQEDEWYARSSEGSFARIGPATPPGKTGAYPIGHGSFHATADLSHIVFEDEAQHVGGYWPFDETKGGDSLYEYVGTGNKEPFLVGVTGEEHSTSLISTCGAELGNRPSSTRNALSGDGRTVFFTAQTGGNASSCPGGTGTNAGKVIPANELYARVDGESTDAHSVLISAPTTGVCTTEECKENSEAPVQLAGNPNARNAAFEGASADGSRVFFSSAQQLTDNATEGSNNLYESLCAEPCGTPAEEPDASARRLIDLSESSQHTQVAGGPRFNGVVAISADGSHVYFVAQGVLTSEARPGCLAEFEHLGVMGPAAGEHCKAHEGASNLYVSAAGRTSFVASLPAADDNPNFGWLFGANVTPDGRFFVFTSHGALTPDDTRTDGSTQVFRYDAGSGGAGSLTRISIGEEGFNDDGNAGMGMATIAWSFVGERPLGPARGDPTMSNDGSYVFFQSPIALTPHALNDVVSATNHQGLPIYAQNVYEWHEGHVYLISDGRDVSAAETPCNNRILDAYTNGIKVTETAGSGVCLLGADAMGHNVFFMTADQLVPKDTDTQVDIYDARVCEPENGNPCISEPPPPLPPCGGEQCHGIPPERSPLLTGGSETFNGKGNLTPRAPAVVKSLTRAQKLANALHACKKDKNKKKRVACEKQAKKKYGAAKKSSKTDRRTKS